MYRLQILRIKYSSRSSLLSPLLHHLSSHPLPSLHYVRVYCYDVSDVRALTTFLPQCTNLRTLYYVRDRKVSESAEKEMWEAAVRSCKDLEEVRVSQEYGDEPCVRLMSVMRKLSEKEGIQALKLRKIVGEVREDYAKQVKHLLPALQQQSQHVQHKSCCLL